jgi:hypothetical protein
MTTEMEPQNADSKERPEVYRPDDAGRQPETGMPVPEERGIEGPDPSPGSQTNVSHGDIEHAGVCERDAMLCPAVPYASAPANAPNATDGTTESSREASSLIVDMNLLDIRIRIENILQCSAKHHWQDNRIDIRNTYAHMFETGSTTFDIARQYCEDHELDSTLCHDVYRERNQLC